MRPLRFCALVINSLFSRLRHILNLIWAFAKSLMYFAVRAAKIMLNLAQGLYGKKLLLQRYKVRNRVAKSKHDESQSAQTPSFNFKNLKVVFINLDSRVDRLGHITSELKRIGLKGAKRQPAVKRENGALGCSLSHIEVLSKVALSADELLMVCEDDCQFLVPKDKLGSLLKEFNQNSSLDVLCLAYNVVGKHSSARVSNLLSITNNSQTTACYVLKAHMIEPLAEVFAESARALEVGKPMSIYAIDQLWKKLQQTYLFSIPNSRVARQVESHSDIEGRTVFYGV